MKVTPLGDGRYEVATESGRSIAYGIRRAGETWVFLDGRVYVIGATDARAGVGRRDEASLAAPMPATVIAINVTAGQAVKAGDVLVVLEAMKMELPIRALGDATVAAIRCKEGELVQADAVLVEFR